MKMCEMRRWSVEPEFAENLQGGPYEKRCTNATELVECLSLVLQELLPRHNLLH